MKEFFEAAGLEGRLVLVASIVWAACRLLKATGVVGAGGKPWLPVMGAVIGMALNFAIARVIGESPLMAMLVGGGVGASAAGSHEIGKAVLPQLVGPKLAAVILGKIAAGEGAAEASEKPEQEKRDK